jgi:hypothetical protein
LDEKFLQSNCQAGELLFSEILDGAGMMRIILIMMMMMMRIMMRIIMRLMMRLLMVILMLMTKWLMMNFISYC